MPTGASRFAEIDPDAPAVVDARGRVWTRGRLDALANRAARALLACGLSRGDVLAIMAPNCPEFLALYFAGVRAGLHVVPVNWRLASRELEFVLEHCGARAVICHGRLGSACLDAAAARGPRGAVLVSLGAAAGFSPLERFVAGRSPRPLEQRPQGRLLAYTSATTGRPKGVQLPLDNAETASARMVRWHTSLGIEPEAGNVHLCASMLYHAAPLKGAVTALEMGHCVVLVDRWEPRALLELIERHRVTTAFMVPTMFVRLLELPAALRARHSTASLRCVIHGGGPCPIDVKRRMLDWWGPVIWESYGATEGQGTAVDARTWLERPGTVGRPIPGSDVKIVGEDGRELPAGTPGRVFLRPYTGDRFEYRGDPAATRASRRGDYITVGDVGYLDADGHLYLCGRAAEVILSGGANIYPAEIENVLLQHPGVADCAVFAVDHALFGAVPKAVIEPAAGAAPGDGLEADVLGWLAERLAPMKIPQRIELVARLPRDPSGKLDRRRLAASRP